MSNDCDHPTLAVQLLVSMPAVDPLFAGITAYALFGGADFGAGSRTWSPPGPGQARARAS